jgi:microtubule-associated protein, RP/EB family
VWVQWILIFCYSTFLFSRSDYEFVSNYKLLQVAFTKNNVQRHVDVDKLIRAKYQDNLEFCQWLKAFVDQSGAERDDYDPSAVRARGKGGKKYNELLDKTASKHGSKPLPVARGVAGVSRPSARTTTPPTPAPRSTATTTRGTTTTGARPTTTTAKPLKETTKNTSTGPTTKKNTSNNALGPEAADAVLADAMLLKKNAEMSVKVVELETSVIELEKERDFYFNKLRNIEFMLQIHQDKAWEGIDMEGIVGNVFKVLYATAEEDVAVNEAGDVIPLDALGGEGGVDSSMLSLERSMEDPSFMTEEDENLLAE